MKKKLAHTCGIASLRRLHKRQVSLQLLKNAKTRGSVLSLVTPLMKWERTSDGEMKMLLECVNIDLRALNEGRLNSLPSTLTTSDVSHLSSLEALLE